MGEKKRNPSPRRGGETDEFDPADEAQKRRQTKDVDEIDDGTPDEHEEGGRRRLIGKRHS